MWEKWWNSNYCFGSIVFHYQRAVKNGIKEAYSAITEEKTDIYVR